MAAFAEATRILFKIIQTTHHLQNTAVTGGKTVPPASLQRKMRELATLVRPASPTEDTMMKLAGNALNWLHTCMQILEEHYQEILQQLTERLKRIHLRNWPEAFQVATRWARKKFGRKLHRTTLDIAERTITPTNTQRSTTNTVSTSNRYAALADTPPPPPRTWRTMATAPQDRHQNQYQKEWPALRQTTSPRSPAPTQRRGHHDETGRKRTELAPHMYADPGRTLPGDTATTHGETEENPPQKLAGSIPGGYQVGKEEVWKKTTPNHPGHSRKNNYTNKHSEEHYKHSLHKQQIRSTGRHPTTPTQDMEDHGHSTPGPAPEPVPKRVASPEADDFPQKPCTYTKEVQKNRGRPWGLGD
ncbi:hypothetical protein SKAU_G00386680 [Synaphobranchus kaupii]|uniref:Uncharacterized protein n=1 Tax=Synaphobranchus kaupii TaxID=118154 RepID=A0A9Q1ICD5_SYNKA|nr:hypothetical protein SKAU_G00386670 [Synaphobranchus kaupii]KAJ8335326.1 hypothetical protein SKAU_G00386680 [Synaphobranchus kaupii]